MVCKNLSADIEVFRVIRNVHPDYLFILDSNEGYKPKKLLKLLKNCTVNDVINTKEAMDMESELLGFKIISSPMVDINSTTI